MTTCSARYLSRAATVVLLSAMLVLSGCSYFPKGGLFGIGTRGEVHWGEQRTWCLPWRLKRVVRRVAFKFGDVYVSSTKRSKERNDKVGGASRSLHLTCKAIDFKVNADPDAVLAYLKSQDAVGGLKYYADLGHFHIDTGTRRSW